MLPIFINNFNKYLSTCFTFHKKASMIYNFIFLRLYFWFVSLHSGKEPGLDLVKAQFSVIFIENNLGGYNTRVMKQLLKSK